MDCDNKLQNLQRILPNGKKANFYRIVLPKDVFIFWEQPQSLGTNTIYIAEGYATAATIHESTEQCTVVAFSVNNLPAVAENHQMENIPMKRSSFVLIMIFTITVKNIGLDKATEAANDN